MYHQIDTPPKRGTSLRGLIVSPGSFARQMWVLRLLGYKGLSMRDLEPYLFGGKTGKVVGITFDDGYQNNLHNALPALKKYGFTATCYAVSSLIGGTNEWDKGKVAEKRLMNKDEWFTWLRSGMEVGSHTQTHADLTKLSDNASMQEIRDSKLKLEETLNTQVTHFCYPYGRFTPEHIEMVRIAGYTSATTTRRGRVLDNSSPFQCKRVLIARATSLLMFLLKIGTSYEDKKG